MAWGYHLILDCYEGDKKAIADADTIYDFTKELVKAIDMVAYGEPQIVHFGTDDKAGYTLIQLIETSNIAAHFCNDTGNFYMDIFSCKHFKPSVVEEIIAKYFAPQRIHSRFIERD
jgi:S-adenosylmethionine/arginine decarboxylase-like enzyme